MWITCATIRQRELSTGGEQAERQVTQCGTRIKCLKFKDKIILFGNPLPLLQLFIHYFEQQTEAAQCNSVFSAKSCSSHCNKSSALLSGARRCRCCRICWSLPTPIACALPAPISKWKWRPASKRKTCRAARS